MSKKSFDMDDKELDDLLRKISDSPNLPFSEDDWSEMKERLDRDPATSSYGTSARFLSWAAAMLMAGMILFLALNHNEQLPISNPEAAAYETASMPEPEKASPSPIGSIASQQHGAADGAENKLVTSSPSHTQEKQDMQEVDWQKIVSIRENGSFTYNNTLGTQSRFPALPVYPTTAFLNHPVIDFEGADGKMRSSGLEKETVIRKKKPDFAGRFNVSVQLAPDLSGVNINQMGQAGSAAGVGAEYFLVRNLSISGGITYAFKPYTTRQGYQQGYGKQPDKIFGECDILDIPLNLRFYPLEGKLQRMFLSTGLSSYLMLKEHYELSYPGDGPYEEPYTTELDIKGKNNHFFGIINFSVGYERKLGKQLGIQVEPYFKLPLEGVGEGDISLKSAGLFVGLKYYPFRPERK